jgi:hypothetical protein
MRGVGAVGGHRFDLRQSKAQHFHDVIRPPSRWRFQIAMNDALVGSFRLLICLAIGNASSSGIGPMQRSASVGPSTSSTRALMPSFSSRPDLGDVMVQRGERRPPPKRARRSRRARSSGILIATPRQSRNLRDRPHHSADTNSAGDLIGAEPRVGANDTVNRSNYTGYRVGGGGKDHVEVAIKRHGGRRTPVPAWEALGAPTCTRPHDGSDAK